MGKFRVSLVVEVEAKDHQGAAYEAMGTGSGGDSPVAVKAAVVLDLASREARAFTLTDAGMTPSPMGVPI